MQKKTKMKMRSAAAKQRWARNDEKETFWRKHIEEWKESGQSKRGYCREHGLSESSFSAWKREIDLRDREQAASPDSDGLKDDFSVFARGTFVPLRVVPDKTESASRSEDPAASEGAVKVLVPGGGVLLVGQGCRVELAAEIFRALKEQV